jgi:hypothetical protein
MQADMLVEPTFSVVCSAPHGVQVCAAELDE